MQMKQSFEKWDKEVLLNSAFFEPLHPALSRLGGERFPSLCDCNTLLSLRQPLITVRQGLPLRFVEQRLGRLPFEEQYEPLCYIRGEVQTRENNLHDLFNALVWLTFPKSKTAINSRHYQALTERGIPEDGSRGAVRDMNTLFDESGLVVVCSDTELLSLLGNFCWKELFWNRRDEVKSKMAFYLFGHGLYEKVMHPYIGLTGQGLFLSVGDEFFVRTKAQQLELLDSLVADYIQSPSHCLSTRELGPVPLLGVPGWAEENCCGAYYDNTVYFRGGRRRIKMGA